MTAHNPWPPDFANWPQDRRNEFTARNIAFHKAKWADLSDMRLIDLVGENSVLGMLMKGHIEPTPMFHALDAFIADFEPSLTILDVLAEMFAGQESDGAQVRQFVNLLKHLARKRCCAVLLLAHPSLTGMNTGTAFRIDRLE